MSNEDPPTPKPSAPPPPPSTGSAERSGPASTGKAPRKSATGPTATAGTSAPKPGGKRPSGTHRAVDRTKTQMGVTPPPLLEQIKKKRGSTGPQTTTPRRSRVPSSPNVTSTPTPKDRGKTQPSAQAKPASGPRPKVQSRSRVEGFPARTITGLPPRAAKPTRPKAKKDDRPAATAGEMVVSAAQPTLDEGGTISVDASGLRTPSAVLEAYSDDALLAIADYEQALTTETEPARISRLHYEIGRLFEAVLGNLDQAAAHLDQALAATPQHLPTIVCARRVRLRKGDAAGALELFDREIEQSPSRERAAALWFSKAQVLGDRLGRADEARAAYVAATQAVQADPALLKALEHTDRARQDWAALSRDLEQIANAVAQRPRLRAAIVAERARLHEVHTDEPALAAELYESALEIDDAIAGDVLPVLRRLHEQGQRWRDLIRVLEREAEHTRDPHARAAALYRIARIHADRLGDATAAIAALERSNETVSRAATLAALAELHAQRGDDGALATTLTDLVERVADPAQQRAIFLRLARLCHGSLDDDELAITALEAARELAPADPAVIHLLAPLYTQQQRWDALVALYEGQAQACGHTLTRAEAHANAAQIRQRQDRHDDAIEHHRRALDLDPTRDASMRALVHLYSRAGDHDALVALYERFIERVDVERRIAFLLEIATLHAGPRNDPTRALAAIERVLTLDPKHLRAVHMMQRVAEAAGDWPALVKALQLEVTIVAEPAQRVPLWQRIGEVLELRQQQPEDAITVYRKALGHDGSHRATLSALARLFTVTRRFGELARVYEQTLALDPKGDDAVSLLQRLGQLHEHELASPTKAVDCYRRALALDPHASEAATGLARIWTQKRNHSGLAELYEQQREHARDPDDTLRFALAAGELFEEHLHDLDRASRSYANAHDARPGDRPATEALRRVRAQQNQWTSLAEDLEREAPEHREPANTIADLSYAAEIRAERLREPAAAVANLYAVLEHDPTHIGTLLALEPLLRTLGDHDGLIELYTRQVDVFDDPGAKVAALHEHARLLAEHHPERVEALLTTYSSILTTRPDDHRALQALEALALEHGKTKALAGVDARLARLAPRADLRAAYLTRRAEAMEVGGNPEALKVYREALKLDPQARGALRGLTRMAELLRDHEALADAAERAAENASTPQGAADAWVRAGTIKAERLEDHAGAIEDFDRALAKWPNHADAAAALGTVMRKLGRQRSLVERLVRAAEAATDEDQITALWLEVAALQSGDLDNASAAQASLEHLLRVRPGHAGAMLELGRLYVDDRRHDDAIELLGRCLATKPEPAIAHGAHSVLAQAHENEGRADEAFTHYSAALQAAPNDAALLRRVARLQLEHGHHAAAVDASTRLLEMCSDRADRAEVLRWIAQAQLGLGRNDAAIDTLAEAVAFLGPRSPAAKQMIEHARRVEHWDRYVEALTSYLRERSHPGPARIALFAEIAQLQHERLSDDTSAVATLLRGLAQSDGDSDLRMRLAERLVSARRPAEAVPHLQILIADDPGRPEPWRLLTRGFADMGRTREQQLCTAGLVTLGRATEREAETLHGWRPHTRGIRPGLLVPGAWPELQLGGDQQTAVANVLASICDGLGKLRPPDLSAWGVASRDRIAPRSDHPLRVLVDRLATLFALDELDVYVHRHHGRGVGIENTSRPSLLLPIWLSELQQSQQIFLIAQGLAHISRGTYPVHLMAPQDLALTVTAAVRAVVPGYGQGMAAAGALDDRARLITRGIPRRKRKMHESTAQVCAGMTPLEPHVLVHWLHQTAGRVAAIVADDLLATVDVIRRTDDIEVDRGPDLLARSPVIADLLRMWVGEPAMLVRRRLGLITAAT